MIKENVAVQRRADGERIQPPLDLERGIGALVLRERILFVEGGEHVVIAEQRVEQSIDFRDAVFEGAAGIVGLLLREHLVLAGDLAAGLNVENPDDRQRNADNHQIGSDQFGDEIPAEPKPSVDHDDDLLSKKISAIFYFIRLFKEIQWETGRKCRIAPQNERLTKKVSAFFCRIGGFIRCGGALKPLYYSHSSDCETE